MLAFDVGPPEIIVLVLLILLLFGAKKLPEIGRGMGKGIREFRDATKGIGDDVKAGMDGDEKKPADPTAKDDTSSGGSPPGR
jgi:sec-independent protein translocase protein TatA